MRVRDLHEQIIAPTRPAPYVDEAAWCSLVDALIAAVRDEERTGTRATLDRLAVSAAALPTAAAVVRLIAGIAERDYREVAAR